MDPIIQSNPVFLPEPSFPLFNLELLSKASFENGDLSHLPSLDQISKAVQVKLQQEINLEHSFELFGSPDPQKSSSSSKGKGNRKDLRLNHGKKDVQSSKIKPKFAYQSQRKSKKQQGAQFHPEKTNFSPEGLVGKRSLPSLGEESKAPRNFPSLASILGDSEGLSDEEEEPPIDKIEFASEKKGKKEQNDSLFKSEFFPKGTYELEKSETKEKDNSDETSSILDQNVELFAEFLHYDSPQTVEDQCVKKVKYDDCLVGGPVNAFGFYSAFGEKKRGIENSYGKGSLSNLFICERKLEEGLNRGFFDGAFLTSTSVHL